MLPSHRVRDPGPSAGWVLAGILGGVLLAALVLFLRNRKGAEAEPEQKAVLQPLSAGELVPTGQDFQAGRLWQRAEDLAGAGHYREAVRYRFLGVLALFHEANLIRFERTRTNGDYARQLRDQPSMYLPFRQLVARVEASWFGTARCGREEDAGCRELAGQLQEQVERTR